MASYKEILGSKRLPPTLTDWVDGGGGGIRTLETLARLPVFKTGAFNRSATPPVRNCRRSEIMRLS